MFTARYELNLLQIRLAWFQKSTFRSLLSPSPTHTPLFFLFTFIASSYFNLTQLFIYLDIPFAFSSCRLLFLSNSFTLTKRFRSPIGHRCLYKYLIFILKMIRNLLTLSMGKMLFYLMLVLQAVNSISSRVDL